jgi:HSP20 family protein
MALVRWNPFDLMTAWDREVQDMMSRAMSRGQTGNKTEWSWQPRTEVFKEGDQLIVRVEVPGIDPQKDVEIELEANVLRIRGRRSFDREINDEDMYLSERVFGSFTRDLALPEGVDPEQLAASYDAGVLTVSMPLPSALGPKVRKIPVGGGAEAPTAIETSGSEEGDTAQESEDEAIAS